MFSNRDRAGDASRQSGQVIVFTVVALAALLGMAAFVIDIGYAYFTQRSLQASADAAALAGAQQLPDPAVSAAVAKLYGTGPTAKNANTRATSITELVTTKCIATVPGCNPVNTVVVDETAQVDTYFAQLLGFKSFKIHARSTACSPCGVKPLDVMVVLDRTGSMCQNSSGGSDPACTDLNNARTGIKTFLSYLDPATEWVGLAVLPPASSLGAKCSTPATSNYNSTGSPYVLVPLSKDYKFKSGALNSSSNLITTLDCVKGAGNTAYANAIEAAQGELNAHGRPAVQDVIVFLSDGAANLGPTYYPITSAYRTQPCHQGVSSAGYSKSSGALVYTIGYALDDDTGGCTSYTGKAEKPVITVYDAMQGMASSAGDFYNKPTPGQLNTIYTQIAADISRGTAALINDNTP